MSRLKLANVEPVGRHALAASAVVVLVAGVCLSGAVAVPLLPDRFSSEVVSEVPAELPFDESATTTITEMVETTTTSIPDVVETTTTAAEAETTTTTTPAVIETTTTVVPEAQESTTRAPADPSADENDRGDRKKVPDVELVEPGDV